MKTKPAIKRRLALLVDLKKTYICMSSLKLDIGQWTIIYFDTKCLSTVQLSQPAERKENQNY